MLLTNASGFPFCPTGDTLCGCPQLRHTEFHSKGAAMKISLLSDLASSTWVLLWRPQLFWGVLIQKTSALCVARLSTAQCQPQESNCAFNLKLHSVRNEQQQPWQLYGPFDLRLLACQHQSYFMVSVHIGKYLIWVPEWQPGNSITGRKIFLL